MDTDLVRERLLLNDTTNGNGHRHLRATLGTLASFFVVLLAASSASAAILNVSGGQLLGASGVIVDGSSYNVEFLDGTCIALYSGCDDVSDFTFETLAAAGLAAQALLDQVFVDGTQLFDTDPTLTIGCSDPISCTVFTPYGLSSPSDVEVTAAVNYPEEPGDYKSFTAIQRVWDLSTYPSHTYVIWTPVPEPGTAVLMGSGLLGLSVRKRRDG